ncbi:MAG: FKBP-type peptidyl-prolyl cis-trans isomerase [Cellvibrionaceae bacterium]
MNLYFLSQYRLIKKFILALLPAILLLLSCHVFSETAEQSKQCRAPGAQENLRKANEYLALNKTKEGVITTKTGLQYRIEKSGDGKTIPSPRNEVVAHYELFNLAGKKLESSRDRGIPLQFKVARVIKGWTEALLTMSVGEQRILTIPPHLAYGCKGAGRMIGSNELLIFNMELVHIEK